MTASQLSLLKAKFHYASWFRAGSEHVWSWFGACSEPARNQRV